MPLRVGDRVPHLDEDSLHEFKMHTKIAIEEVPRKCSVNDKGKIVRTMQPASKTISAMLNTEGGRIYLGITDDGVIEGLVLNDSQIDHMYLSLHDTLARFRPPVPPELIKVRFEKLEPAGGSKIVRIAGGDEGGKEAGWLRSGSTDGAWAGEIDFDEINKREIVDGEVKPGSWRSKDVSMAPTKKGQTGTSQRVVEHSIRTYKCVCESANYSVNASYLVAIEITKSPDGTIYENEEGLTYRRRNGSNKCFNVAQLHEWTLHGWITPDPESTIRRVWNAFVDRFNTMRGYILV